MFEKMRESHSHTHAHTYGGCRTRAPLQCLLLVRQSATVTQPGLYFMPLKKKICRPPVRLVHHSAGRSAPAVGCPEHYAPRTLRWSIDVS